MSDTRHLNQICEALGVSPWFLNTDEILERIEELKRCEAEVKVLREAAEERKARNLAKFNNNRRVTALRRKYREGFKHWPPHWDDVEPLVADLERRDVDNDPESEKDALELKEVLSSFGRGCYTKLRMRLWYLLPEDYEG